MHERSAVRTLVMDQIHMQFVPNILVVQTGSAVDFPNSDQKSRVTRIPIVRGWVGTT